MKRFLPVALILLVLFVGVLTGCSPDGSATVADLQQQVQTLKAENEALKNENQVLRKLVLEAKNSIPATFQPDASSSVAGVQTPTTAPEAKYWMTISSSKRHNSSCRYFMNSKGRFCGPNEGIPCKLCGG